MLVADGYTNVVDFRAGFGGAPGQPGWRAAGLPVSQEAAPGHAFEELK